jgi:hypothetical protein
MVRPILGTHWRQGIALRQLRPFPPARATMQYLNQLGPVAALIAGVLILIMPKLLNYIIALYLIVTGLIGIFGR